MNAELKNTLESKEELVTDLKNIIYRHADELEKQSKMLKDADKQLAQCLEQIKNMIAEKAIYEKELAELRSAAQAVADMVDPIEGEVAASSSLVERLRGVPKRLQATSLG